jgi:hypothetical protein
MGLLCVRYPSSKAMVVYVLGSMGGLLLIHFLEKTRYLRRLKELAPDRWTLLVGSASYRWFGSFSPILLRYVFSAPQGESADLDTARRSYRHSEVFFFVAAVIVVLMYYFLKVHKS